MYKANMNMYHMYMALIYVAKVQVAWGQNYFISIYEMIIKPGGTWPLAPGWFHCLCIQYIIYCYSIYTYISIYIIASPATILVALF